MLCLSFIFPMNKSAKRIQGEHTSLLLHGNIYAFDRVSSGTRIPPYQSLVRMCVGKRRGEAAMNIACQWGNGGASGVSCGRAAFFSLEHLLHMYASVQRPLFVRRPHTAATTHEASHKSWRMSLLPAIYCKN